MTKVLRYKIFSHERDLTLYVNENNISQESIVTITSSTKVFPSGGSDYHKNTDSEVWFTLFFYESKSENK